MRVRYGFEVPDEVEVEEEEFATKVLFFFLAFLFLSLNFLFLN